jgi:hypothetical protein
VILSCPSDIHNHHHLTEVNSQDEFKAVNLAKDNLYPILIGRDCNLLRFRHEKSKGHFDGHWPFLFNIVIDSLDLREVLMIGQNFKWASNLPNPTYKKLDCVLMDTNWEDKFTMVSVRSLEHIARLSGPCSYSVDYWNA